MFASITHYKSAETELTLNRTCEEGKEEREEENDSSRVGKEDVNLTNLFKLT